MQFEGFTDRDQVESWRGVVLRAEPLEVDDDVLWVHELVGSTVVLPTVTRSAPSRRSNRNPAADLLVLDSGALVPVVFITEHEQGRVTIDPPEGLFDL